MRVAQILCAAGPVDGVTGQALAYRRLFERWGWTGEDHAPVQAAAMPPGAIQPLHRFRRRAADAVVVHYSGYAPGLEQLIAEAGPSLLVSHNITPAHYFWASDPVEAVRCQLARGQLASLAVAATRLAGVSELNAGELRAASGREATVIPVLFDRSPLPPPTPPPAPDPDRDSGPDSHAGPAAPTVLFVGRLTPHKRQDLVIRAFARWHVRRPEARLVLVGTPLSPGFAAGLAGLAQRLAPGAVTFESGLAFGELWSRYREAGAFLCLSEHEGFCIPLLEAFHFHVPVIAREAGAVGEVVGDAGVLVDGEDTTATIAELLELVAGDAELRGELAARGERRLAAFDYERVAAQVRAEVEALAAGRAR